MTRLHFLWWYPWHERTEDRGRRRGRVHTPLVEEGEAPLRVFGFISLLFLISPFSVFLWLSLSHHVLSLFYLTTFCLFFISPPCSVSFLSHHVLSLFYLTMFCLFVAFFISPCSVWTFFISPFSVSLWLSLSHHFLSLCRFLYLTILCPLWVSLSHHFHFLSPLCGFLYLTILCLFVALSHPFMSPFSFSHPFLSFCGFLAFFILSFSISGGFLSHFETSVFHAVMKVSPQPSCGYSNPHPNLL